jgi:hypothetical protein
MLFKKHKKALIPDRDEELISRYHPDYGYLKNIPISQKRLNAAYAAVISCTQD